MIARQLQLITTGAALVFVASKSIGRQGLPTAQFQLSSVVAFSSTRDNPSGDPFQSAELYIINPDGSDPRRLTDNEYADAFPTLSPNGRKIVFDTNRARAEGEPQNISDLDVMDWDGENVAHLVRGSSATWSPDGVRIAYHASASGTGRLIRRDPGSAAIDSDIFVLNVDDAAALKGVPTNLTNNPLTVDDDPDWSPDGSKIAFTSHSVTDNHNNSVTAEIWVMNQDGTDRVRLTDNTEEERAPAWSPDGRRIAYMCRKGAPAVVGGQPTFELCVMNADGTDVVRLTTNSVADLTPTWTRNGQALVFHRPVGALSQLFELDLASGTITQLTTPPGMNLLSNSGDIVVRLPHVVAHSVKAADERR